MSAEKEKLTNDQWDSLCVDWKEESNSAKKKKMKRSVFVAQWCKENDVPTPPIASTVTRRLANFDKRQLFAPVRATKVFPKCGHRVDEEILRGLPNSSKNKNYDEDLCPTCNSQVISVMRDYAADKYIMQHMFSKQGPIVDWSDAVSVRKTFFVEEATLPPTLTLCPSFVHFMATPILVRKMIVHDNTPTAVFRSCITGGKHPWRWSYPTEQIAENPGDGSIGLLVFHGTEDFAMVDTSHLSNETIYQLSENEMKIIAEKEKGRRVGNAGGRFIPSHNRDHDVAALTAATKHSRVLVPPADGSRSAKQDVHYVNFCGEKGKGDEPVVKVFHSIYNDIYMRRGNGAKKLAAALQCPLLREKYIAEMKSRLRAFFVMDHYELENRNCPHWTTFMEAVQRVSIGADKKWKRADPWLSQFDIVLLEWCCGTGEMRNHQALCAHDDANKSHSVETMMVFGRTNPTHKHYGKTKQVSLFRDAYLCMLWQMIVLRTRCGKDIWHLSLGQTYHLPDRSRDRYNFSWVHGP